MIISKNSLIRSSKLFTNLVLSSLIFTYFISILIRLLNPHIPLNIKEFFFIFINLLVFYGPLWFLITLIIFLIIQFFSERKYPIGIIKPPSLIYFQTFTYLFITLIYYLNYEYYSDFFSSATRIKFAKILLVNILVLVIGVIFVFLNQKKKPLIILFIILFIISIIFPNMLIDKEISADSKYGSTSFNPAKISSKKINRKLKIVLMNGISYNLIKTIQKEQKLDNFNLLFKNGVRGTFITYNPNLDLALLNSALTGLKPSKFREHSDIKFKFNNLNYKFDIFPRYLFFRYSSILGTTTYFKYKNSNNIINIIKQHYEINRKKTNQLIYPHYVPIYFEKSLAFNDDFVQNFNDALKLTGRKYEILKKAFFYDSYIRQTMKLTDDEIYYSIIRFPGISIINRYFLQYIYPVFGNISESEIKNYKWIIQKYYKYYDSIIGNLLSSSSTKENELLVIISFYEYEPLPAWRRVLLNLFGEKGIYVYKDLNSKGTIFFFENNALKRDYPLKNISIFDIFPTLLYYTGFPFSRELEGEIIREMFTEDFILNNHINIDINN